MEKKTMGSFIAALRRSVGLTQRELAEKLNVSDKAVSRWERDESAPDLMLIPVIAEIFGVTSDELLRGERACPKHSAGRDAAKTELQIRNLLKQALTRYQIRSLISVTIALLGLIAAMALNLGFLKAYAAFYAGFALFLTAVFCQIIFLILGHSSMDLEQLPEAMIGPTRKNLLLGAEAVFGIVFVLIAVCLPLIIFPIGPYSGLTLRSWLLWGSLFGIAGAVIWLIGCTAVNLKRGYWRKPNFQSPINQLRLKWLKNAVLFLLTLACLHMISASLISHYDHLFVRGRQFENWDDFRRYMEAPVDTDGTPLIFRSIEGTGADTVYLYKNQAGDPVALRKEDVSQILYNTDDNSTELVRYRHLNRQITSIHLNMGGLPVQVFTAQQQLTLQIIRVIFHLVWVAGYIFASRFLLRKYRSKIDPPNGKGRP